MWRRMVIGTAGVLDWQPPMWWDRAVLTGPMCEFAGVTN
jgi:hypothetical protein